MVDKPVKTPGSITNPADTKNERIAEVSNVNHAISEMQQKVNQQLSEAKVDVGEFEGIAEVQNSMIKVLNSLNHTVGSIGYGFAKIASETTKASAGAVKQYGKAISEDINLNKQNVVAMALARSSPIFGYFAAKFVETDVFKAAKEKMKSNISEALGGVTSKFKEGMGSLISKARREGKKERPVKAIKPPEEIPKMQAGGYVRKGGMAYLHPAEVVVPIDKILSRIDESISITRDLAVIARKTQLKSIAKISTYVAGMERLEKVGIFRGFMQAMRQVQSRYTEPSNIRMLRAVLAIQDSLGATVGTWSQVWQKMLVEHPTFRQITFAMKSLGSIIGLPFKFIYSIFKSRGGYQTHLSRSKNPLEAMVENIGLIYTEGMWRLDNIALYTRATAESTRDLSSAITGKVYGPLEGVPRGLWSILGIARGLTNWMTKYGTKLIGKSLGYLFEDKRAGEFIENIGIILTKKYRIKERRLQPGIGGVKTRDVYGPGTTYLGSGVNEEIEQEAKRISAIPVSEIHLARFVEQAESYMINNKKHQRKLLGYTSDIVDIDKDEYKITKRMDQRERRKSIFGFFGGAFGAIKNLIGSGLAFIMPMLTGFLVPAIKSMGKKLVGFILPAIKSMAIKLFPVVRTAITALLGSSVLWTAIAGAAAAAFGLAIGRLFDKLIGISSGFTKSLERMDERARKASEIQTKVTREKFEIARGGGVAGYEALQELQLKAQLGGLSKERAANVGMFGRRHLLAIDTAQQKYMNENIDEYLKYGPGQIQALRREWVKGGAFPTKHVGYVPAQYGAEREAAFLKYIKIKGKPLSEIERQAGYQAYAYKYHDKYTLRDRASGIARDVGTIAKESAEIATMQIKAMKEGLKEQAKDIKEGAERLGQGISSSVIQATNAVTTSVQNIQHTVHNSTQRIRDIFSEYDYAVIKGDYLSEDF